MARHGGLMISLSTAILLLSIIQFFVFPVSSLEIVVSPSSLAGVYWSDKEHKTITVTAVNCSSPNDEEILTIVSSDVTTVAVEPPEMTVNCSANGTVIVTGKFIGSAQVSFSWGSGDDQKETETEVYVIKKPGLIEAVFQYGLICFIISNTLGFGATIDLNLIKTYLKKPVAPAIGFGCQFILMPLVSFAMAKMLSLDSRLALGAFATGTAPGGGGSNIWSLLLQGDVDLSIAMTFFSSVAAFAMIPLWMYTLGSYLVSSAGTAITVPFEYMAITLSMIVGPLLVGVLVNTFLPKVGKIIQKSLKYSAIAYIIFLLSVGIATYYYVFILYARDYKFFIAGVFLPYIGFVAGGVIAAFLKQSRSQIITIAIETGMQNTAIAMTLLSTSLEPKYRDMAIAVPVSVSIMTPIPLVLAWIGYLIYTRCYKRKSSSKSLTSNDSRLDLSSPKSTELETSAGNSLGGRDTHRSATRVEGFENKIFEAEDGKTASHTETGAPSERVSESEASFTTYKTM